MTSWKHKALHAAALLALAATGVQSAHAADPFISASLQLNGLTFQLIDLDPNDGIAPSFALGPSGSVLASDYVNGAWTGSGEVPITIGYGTNTTTPFTSTTAAGLSTLKVGTNSLSSNSSLAANNVSHTVSDPFVYTYTDGTGSYQETTTYENTAASTRTDLSVNPYLTSSSYDPNTEKWVVSFDGTLSAHTLLVVTGQVSQNATVNRSAVLSAMGTPVDTYAMAQAYSYVDIKLGAASPGYEDYFRIWTDDSVDGAGGLSRSSFKSNVSLTYAAGSTPDAVMDDATQALITDNLAQINKSQTFTLVASNTSAGSAGMSLGLRAFTGAEISNPLTTTTVVPIDPGSVVTPTIPEPSTYGLMGLGLVGISLVVRRRQAQA
jgi:hypothetical protein